MSYTRITPLPDDHQRLASAELPALVGIWHERRHALEEEGRLGPFLTRLKREWAIETGLIERLYTWDRGVTEVLIEQGIDASIITSRTGYDRDRAEQARHLVLDQENVVEGLFEFVKGGRPLSEHYVRSLHQALTVNQASTPALEVATGRIVEVELRRGQYKQLANNPRRPDGTVHEYCPPELVTDEMQALVQGYLATEGVASEVLAAWLHHRFTQIHPFQDGNGRVARALATLVFLKAELFPLVVRDSDRGRYIDALEDADEGDLQPLIALFARRQRDVILGALSAERAVEARAARHAIIADALAQLTQRQAVRDAEMRRVFDASADLHDVTSKRLAAVAAELDAELRLLTPRDESKPYNAESKGSTDETRHWFRNQLIETARALGYWADLDTEHRWSRLSLQTGVVFELVVSLHGLGRDFAGVLVASAFVDTRYQDEGGAAVTTDARPACVEPFQFNYLEAVDVTKTRFDAWLEDVITIAMEEWRRSLSG